mmetsp:Transcript_40674/g.69170  ORF Transcript_40674/g.69170 Transcript_40674/m.69170 type:complete len:86 (-) Transcript_40674:101-358(-)
MDSKRGAGSGNNSSGNITGRTRSSPGLYRVTTSGNGRAIIASGNRGHYGSGNRASSGLSWFNSGSLRTISHHDSGSNEQSTSDCG